MKLSLRDATFDDEELIKKFIEKAIEAKVFNLEVENSSNLKGRFEDVNLDGSLVININGCKKNIYSARIINDCN